MKLAAVKAIASLAKETIPEEVLVAYGDKSISFGREQIIPKPLDQRLIYYVAPAVAKAAMESGVARNPITNWEAYEIELKSFLFILFYSKCKLVSLRILSLVVSWPQMRLRSY